MVIFAESNTLFISAEPNTLSICAESDTLFIFAEPYTLFIFAESYTLAISAESYTLFICAELNTLVISAEPNTLFICAESYTLFISAEPDTLVIFAEPYTLSTLPHTNIHLSLSLISLTSCPAKTHLFLIVSFNAFIISFSAHFSDPFHQSGTPSWSTFSFQFSKSGFKTASCKLLLIGTNSTFTKLGGVSKSFIL